MRLDLHEEGIGPSRQERLRAVLAEVCAGLASGARPAPATEVWLRPIAPSLVRVLADPSIILPEVPQVQLVELPTKRSLDGSRYRSPAVCSNIEIVAGLYPIPAVRPDGKPQIQHDVEKRPEFYGRPWGMSSRPWFLISDPIHFLRSVGGASVDTAQRSARQGRRLFTTAGGRILGATNLVDLILLYGGNAVSTCDLKEWLLRVASSAPQTCQIGIDQRTIAHSRRIAMEKAATAESIAAAARRALQAKELKND